MNRYDFRKIALIGAIFFVVLTPLVMWLNPSGNISASMAKTEVVSEIKTSAFPLPEREQKYGLYVEEYDLVEDKIKNNEFLSIILDKHGISTFEVDKVAKKAIELELNPPLVVGKKYKVLKNKETGKAEFFIYEPNPYRYFKYDLRGEMNVEEIEKTVEKRIGSLSGLISSSLWNAIVENKGISNAMGFAVAANMEDALQWTVDFHHVQKNDKFRLIYEEDWIDGELVGLGRLIACHFNHYNQDNYVIRFKNDNYDGFFDLEGRPSKRSFLKAPVKYSRISSSYNLRRFHPVLKRVKAHLGTDYAAPYGTPILATADGYIERIGRTRGNGNFIKVKHDATYATQYLHMQKFAKGMTKGTHVSQGQTIGYIGSTGLATGPHVCY
ncbi:MAG: peptidoglycan DD-metalloendopeptidase family protein, partial [Saprospiraceae bacterium]